MTKAETLKPEAQPIKCHRCKKEIDILEMFRLAKGYCLEILCGDCYYKIDWIERAVRKY